ncbi:Uncharacterized protein QTN25_007911 [Entamoeba marina]
MISVFSLSYSFITLCCLFTISSSCFTDFFVVNSQNITHYDDSFPTITMSKNCFDSIPNYQSTLSAHIYNRVCYFHESFYYMNYSTGIVPRCGEYYEITSPSTKKVHCMFAGTFTFTFNTTDDIYEYFQQMILVPDELFQYLTYDGLLNDGNELQISLKIINSPYKLLPKLHILNWNNEILSVIPYDDSKLMAFMLYNNTTYYPNVDGIYEINIPTSISTKILTLFHYVSISNEVITFHSTDSFYENSVLIATSHLSQTNNIDECTFLPTSYIWDNDNIQSQYSLFQWMIQAISNNSVFNFHNVQSIYFQSVSDSMIVIFKYPTYFKIPLHFNYLEGDFMLKDDETTIVNVSLAKYVNETDITYDNTCTNLPTETHYEADGNIDTLVHFKTLLSKRCLSFNNAIIIEFNTSYNVIFQLLNAQLLNTISNDKSCSLNNFNCDSMLCTPPNTNTCYPDCGTCKRYYSCTSSGRCELNITTT